MKKIKPNLVVLLFIIYICCSCTTIKDWFKSKNEKNREAKANAERLITDLEKARRNIYSQVIAIKRDTSINKVVKDSLKNQYAAVVENFNENFDGVILAIDTNKIDAAKCIIMNYKRVLAPYENRFTKSSELGDKFITESVRARKISASGIAGIATIVIPLFKELAKHRVEICKTKITQLKFQDWEKVNRL